MAYKLIQAIQDGRLIDAKVDEGRFEAYDARRRDGSLKAIIGEKPSYYVGDDGAAMAFLVSQLAYVENRVYERKYLPMQYEEFLTVNSSAGEHAMSVDYELVDRVGIGKPTNPVTNALNMVSAGYARKSAKVTHGNVAYRFTNEDLRQTAYLRRPLNEQLLLTAMEAYRRHLNQVALLGEAQTGLTGLLNNPSVPVGNAPTGKWLAATGAATVDQMIADLNYAVFQVWKGSQYNYFPTHILLPTEFYNKAATTPRSTQSDTTVLEYFLNNNVARRNRNVNLIVEPAYQLDGLGAAGSGRAVAFVKSDEVMSFHVPLPLRFQAPQLNGLAIEVAGEYKYSTVTIRYPKTAFYMEGL